MKQKLGFAQVLIGDAKLIIVDEPTVGLDPEQRNIIRELFPVISRNRIVLATTHIVEDIEYYCNCLLVINNGELIYKGTKENFIKEVDGLLWEADFDAETLINITENNLVLTTIYNEKSMLEGAKEEGTKKGAKSTAQNLFNMGMDIDLIIKATSLSKDEIEKLIN